MPRPRIDELDLLRNKVASLTKELERLRKPLVVSQNSLNTAVSMTLDRLQEALATSANQSSAFSVRELELELPVEVRVGPLGQLDYRLVQVGEDADPATIGRLRLAMVPVPRAGQVDWRESALLSPEPLGSIPELSEEAAKVLQGQGLHTVGELLRVSADARLRAKLVDLLPQGEEKLGTWLDHAELLVVPGMDAPTAKALVDVGVGSIEDLARADAVAVSTKLDDAGQPVDAALVDRWVGTARVAYERYTGRVLPAPTRDVRLVEGLDEDSARKLAAAGVRSLEDLAEVEEAGVRGVPAERLATWKASARWMVRHPDLGGRDAHLLVRGLGRRDPDDPGEQPTRAELDAAVTRADLPARYSPSTVLRVLRRPR